MYDQHWSYHEGAEGEAACAAAVCRVADDLMGEHSGLHGHYRECVSLYEQRRVDTLDAQAYLASVRFAGDPAVSFALCRSLVDTVHADVAGRQRLRPILMTSGADWQTQRRAKRAERYALGIWHEPQGSHPDSWSVLVDAFLDTAITGIGHVHVWGDVVDKRVVVERVPPWEVVYDAEDGRYGEPLDLYRVRYYDESVLLRDYADTEADEVQAARIRSAVSSAKRTPSVRRGCAPRIRVVEAWRVALDDDTPGRHVLAVEGCLLVDEPWTRRRHPFLTMRWARERVGFGGRGLVDEARPLALELDDALQIAQRQHRLLSSRRIYYTAGSIADEHLQANDDEVHVPVEMGAPIPTVEAPPALNPSTLAWVEQLRSYGYQATGVSQMSATAQREPGVTAAVAMRTLADLGAKRFSLRGRMFEDAHITLTDLQLDAVRDLVRAGVSVPSRAPGEETWTTLDWTDVGLDRADYTIQVDVIASLADRAAGRIATAEEMLSSGLVDAEAFSRITPPGGTLDLENETSLAARQYRWLEALMDRFLDAAEDEDPYEGPEEFLEPSGAMRQVVATYWGARLAGAPEHNLELLRKFIAELNAIARELAAQQAPPPAAPAAPPAPPPAV